MKEYKLEIKQLVDYPRCRFYRNFLRAIEKTTLLRVSRTSYLYHYIILCSYVNYRSNYRRLEGVSYLLGPGEWIFRQRELMDSFRQRRPGTVYPILDFLQANHFISYSKVGSGKLVRVRITEWEKFNTALEYNAPGAKAEGFFFVPISKAEELVAMGKCSEMDVLLDLWLHAVYRDERVKGSQFGAVVFFGNDNGDPFLSYTNMAERWGISRATVFRFFQKLRDMDYISILSFPGAYGTAVFLKGYLSVMFQLSDTPIDKREVAMALNVTIEVEDTVSLEDAAVSESVMENVVAKVAEALADCGLPCLSCAQRVAKLYSLSDCEGNFLHPPVRYKLEFGCKNDQRRYQFIISQISEGGERHE